MCIAVALSLRELPTKYQQHPALLPRIFGRGGEEEVQFYYNRKPYPALLPIIVHEEFRIVHWGNGQRRSRLLPASGWVTEDDLQQGLWQNMPCDEVTILANAALDHGVWFPVLQGIEGIYVEDEQRRPVVYMRMIPPTDYFAIMCKAKLMPKLIGEII